MLWPRLEEHQRGDRKFRGRNWSQSRKGEEEEASVYPVKATIPLIHVPTTIPLDVDSLRGQESFNGNRVKMVPALLTPARSQADTCGRQRNKSSSDTGFGVSRGHTVLPASQRRVQRGGWAACLWLRLMGRYEMVNRIAYQPSVCLGEKPSGLSSNKCLTTQHWLQHDPRKGLFLGFYLLPL